MARENLATKSGNRRDVPQLLSAHVAEQTASAEMVVPTNPQNMKAPIARIGALVEAACNVNSCAQPGFGGSSGCPRSGTWGFRAAGSVAPRTASQTCTDGWEDCRPGRNT